MTHLKVQRERFERGWCLFCLQFSFIIVPKYNEFSYDFLTGIRLLKGQIVALLFTVFFVRIAYLHQCF
jgi:hypothetical protein